MNLSPKFYVIGTKYSRTDNVLPLMLSHGVISTGFAGAINLERIMGQDFRTALASIKALIPNASGVAKNTLARFAGIKPGDIIALKSHSAPNGKKARLVIARYAVVSGVDKADYKKIERLVHTIKVDFLDEQEPIELNLGYGQTLHLIKSAVRVNLIFDRYSQVLSEHYSDTPVKALSDKSTHTSEVPARAAYVMERAHNDIQNEMRRELLKLYETNCIGQEEHHVDLIVRLPNKTLLIEVKSSLSPTWCIRESLGQLLKYSWKLNLFGGNVSYVVVGSKEPTDKDKSFLLHITKQTKICLIYCTPSSFIDYKAKLEHGWS